MRVAVQQDLRQPSPQQVLEVQSGGRRRNVHAHVHDPGKLRARGSDEGAERPPGIDEVAALGFGIGPRHRREIDPECLGQAALRRHTVSGGQTSVADRLLDELDDL